MTNYRKKLIEVGLPLVAINAESAREKSIRHGHPSTLHLWWARRPLAACRAVLFASLVDDPDSDPQYLKNDGSVDEDAAGIKRADLFNLIEELVAWENSNNVDVIRSARAEIARCVASRLIETGKLEKAKLVGDGITAQDISVRCHCRPQPMGLDKKAGRVRFSFDTTRLPPAAVINTFLAEYAPPVLDPFAGGGSIPLEAQRLGLRAFASDLNPIPVLINKALIEIPSKFAGYPPVNPESRGVGVKGIGRKGKALIEKEWPSANGLAADVRYYGKWMRDEAEKQIGHLYPKVTITEELARDRPDLLPYVGQQLTIMAWLWARTVASPSPVYQGLHVPLARGYWLSKKPEKCAWVEPIVDRHNKSYRLVVRTGPRTSQQREIIEAGSKLGRGCKFQCLLSEEPIPEGHIKAEGLAGRLGERLLAVVAVGSRSRIYLSPDVIPPVAVERPTDLRGIESPLANDARNLWCLGYGLNTFDKLFTARQLVALTTFSDLLASAREQIRQDAERNGWPADDLAVLDGDRTPTAYADAVMTYLAFALNKCATRNCTQTTWDTPRDSTMAGFSRQAVPMTWDFAEVNPLLESTGSLAATASWVAECLDTAIPADSLPGKVAQFDAASGVMCENAVISTDPPYYDNIAYADLSDFFYVWLRRSLTSVYPSLFATLVTPKVQELIASVYRHDGSKERAQKFFEEGLSKAFSQMKSAQLNDFPLTIFYAFKQTESDEGDDDGDGNHSEEIASTGWETMLEAVIRAGFLVDGTWPIRTERSGGVRNLGRNSLASSVVLVCRPRPNNASLATRKEFITALRGELPEALRNLQRGNIAPVDLAQAAIGPGMATFTRYAKVLESDGSPMTVRTALGLINHSLDEVLAEQEGEFDGDTRWALAWFEQFGMDEGPFGDAETLSKAKNTAINGLVDAGIIIARAGKVRLVKREELAADWNPATDSRLTIWEVTQHLIRILDQKGEMEAADLVRKLGGIAETARDLAYRLYSTCERKKWADEALAYNGLVIVWSELTKLAQAARLAAPSQQRDLF